MAENTLDVRIKQKYDTEANWSSKNPILLSGEVAISSDNGLYKVGNGTSTWSSLSYNNAVNATTATTATKLGTSTVGNAAKPIYLNNGTATTLSSTVGNEDTPVYMNSGTITSTGKKFSDYVPLQNLVTCTKAEYDALINAGTVNENYYYFITDDSNTSPTLIQYITFAANGWVASEDGTEYTQTVTATQITANDEPMVIKSKTYNVGKAEAKAYNKAFGILCDGAGETGDGIVNWKVYKLPTTDITVGLIKIMA